MNMASTTGSQPRQIRLNYAVTQPHGQSKSSAATKILYLVLFAVAIIHLTLLFPGDDQPIYKAPLRVENSSNNINHINHGIAAGSFETQTEAPVDEEDEDDEDEDEDEDEEGDDEDEEGEDEEGEEGEDEEGEDGEEEEEEGEEEEGDEEEEDAEENR